MIFWSLRRVQWICNVFFSFLPICNEAKNCRPKYFKWSKLNCQCARQEVNVSFRLLHWGSTVYIYSYEALQLATELLSIIDWVCSENILGPAHCFLYRVHTACKLSKGSFNNYEDRILTNFGPHPHRVDKNGHFTYYVSTLLFTKLAPIPLFLST